MEDKEEFFEVTVQIFKEAGVWNWSVIQNFGDNDDEPLAYGFAGSPAEAAEHVREEINALWA